MQALLQPTFNKHPIFAYAHHPSLFPGGNSLDIIDQHYQFSRFHSVSVLSFYFFPPMQIRRSHNVPSNTPVERNFAPRFFRRNRDLKYSHRATESFFL